MRYTHFVGTVHARVTVFQSNFPVNYYVGFLYSTVNNRVERKKLEGPIETDDIKRQ